MEAKFALGLIIYLLVVSVNSNQCQSGSNWYIFPCLFRYQLDKVDCPTLDDGKTYCYYNKNDKMDQNDYGCCTKDIVNSTLYNCREGDKSNDPCKASNKLRKFNNKENRLKITKPFTYGTLCNMCRNSAQGVFSDVLQPILDRFEKEWPLAYKHLVWFIESYTDDMRIYKVICEQEGICTADQNSTVSCDLCNALSDDTNKFLVNHFFNELTKKYPQQAKEIEILRNMISSYLGKEFCTVVGSCPLKKDELYNEKYISHKSWAENNYECAICTSAVNLMEQDAVDEVDKLLSKQPNIKVLFDSVKQFIPGMGPKVCSLLKLCDSFKIDNSIIDHQNHISIVNNNPHSTWKAGLNDRFIGASYYDAAKTMGAIAENKQSHKLSYKHYDNEDEIPDNFNSLTNWPQCKSVIGHIRDQSNCGSCWAFASVGAFNDRQCIATNSTKMMSTADLIGCCSFFDCQSYGCSQGEMTGAWDQIERIGVVSGGEYNDKTGCYPQTMPTCAHSGVVYPKDIKKCSDVKLETPKCHHNCLSGNIKLDYWNDKNKVSSVSGFIDMFSVQNDIKRFGSVSAVMDVYEDFLSQKSGIYKHQSGQKIGKHAVRIIGWGTEKKTGYWIVANSWNSAWGEKGFFRLAFDECDINAQFHAGQV